MSAKQIVIPIAVILLLSSSIYAADSKDSAETWTFAVSGDSRNCGDVIMPAIAADAMKHKVVFYWHLGDLRKISAPDQDFLQEQANAGKPADLADYENHAWEDFIKNQIDPWGDVPFFLGIGNHETTKPKSREAFVSEFHDYLDRTELKEQRLKDDPKATQLRTYFHWIRDGIDFIYLDNATEDQFDAEQMKWIEKVLARDRKDDSIRTLVVGMHEALPESISANHSMNEYASGIATGRLVYAMLLKMQNDAHKTVYVLSSHSHYFMDGIFNTEYWKTHGGVLPGWIAGTAGAERYRLPPDASDAKAAKTDVYGYLLATVNPSGEPRGTINFKFEEFTQHSIPEDVVQRFTEPFVHECFVGNRRLAPITLNH
jgi:3',5'-cyclic AMP phosphodiesterase CpdA